MSEQKIALPTCFGGLNISSFVESVSSAFQSFWESFTLLVNHELVCLAAS